MDLTKLRGREMLGLKPLINTEHESLTYQYYDEDGWYLMETYLRIKFRSSRFGEFFGESSY